MTGIYRIISPTGKIYVGQSMDIHNRFKYYKNINQIKRQPKIYNSMKKYGWDNHICEIIEECSIELLNDREVYWKKHYLSIFNQDWNMVLFCNIYDGGGGPLSDDHKKKIGLSKIGNSYRKGIPFSEEARNKLRKPKPEGFGFGKKHTQKTKDKIGNSNRGNIMSDSAKRKISQSRIGIKFTDEHKNKISMSNMNKTRNQKSIIQYNLDGSYIKTWESIRSAESYYSTGIKDVLKGKTVTSSGYLWRYESQPLEDDFILNKYDSSRKIVHQFDLSNNFLREWKSTIEIQNILNIPNSNISDCCRGKQKTCKGFIWKYKN